jgi:hypothetical protein
MGYEREPRYWDTGLGIPDEYERTRLRHRSGRGWLEPEDEQEYRKAENDAAFDGEEDARKGETE